MKGELMADSTPVAGLLGRASGDDEKWTNSRGEPATLSDLHIGLRRALQRLDSIEPPDDTERFISVVKYTIAASDFGLAERTEAPNSDIPTAEAARRLLHELLQRTQARINTISPPAPASLGTPQPRTESEGGETGAAAPSLDSGSVTKNHPDGPKDGCQVWFCGKSVKIKGVLYKVAAFIWNIESTKLEDLIEAVNPEADGNTVKTWATRLKVKLAPLELPWRLQVDLVSRFVRKVPREVA